MTQDDRPRYCRECQRNLQGLPKGRCPKCGLKFDPDNPRTFTASPRKWNPPPAARWTFFILTAALFPVIIYLTEGENLWLSTLMLVGACGPLANVLLVFMILSAVFPPRRIPRLLPIVITLLFVLSPVLYSFDVARNRGLPFGYYGRMNRVRSYVESFPGVTVVDATPRGDSDVHLEGFFLSVVVDGRSEQIEFNHGDWGGESWRLNVCEADAWYSKVKQTMSQ